MKVWALVPAAGSGQRMGAPKRKQYLALGGTPLLLRTLDALISWEGLAGVVVVAPGDEVDRTRTLLAEHGASKVLRVIAGGAERQESVRLGLAALEEAAPDDLVLVHDGVRPFPPVERFDALVRAAFPDGALFAVPCSDTLKSAEGDRDVGTVERSGVWMAQTPQAFPREVLRQALDEGFREGFRGTDEASFVERMGRNPRLVRGESTNIKVTLPEDLTLAEAILAARTGMTASVPIAIGHGYDVHRLAEGRPLILGGVMIPHEQGLLGHSDADVLAHAVADACLGAAGQGDIGRHFPDTDSEWAGASSIELLELVRAIIREAGFRALRVDATLVAERPKVAGAVPTMEENLSRALGIEPRGVTVKATTTEGLGFEGRQEGISAHAVALLGRSDRG